MPCIRGRVVRDDWNTAGGREAGVIISFPLLIPRAPLIPIPKPMGYGIREGKKGSEVEDKNYYIKIKRHR
jgi:hypothetical protein